MKGTKPVVVEKADAFFALLEEEEEGLGQGQYMA